MFFHINGSIREEGHALRFQHSTLYITAAKGECGSCSAHDIYHPVTWYFSKRWIHMERVSHNS